MKLRDLLFKSALLVFISAIFLTGCEDSHEKTNKSESTESEADHDKDNHKHKHKDEDEHKEDDGHRH